MIVLFVSHVHLLREALLAAVRGVDNVEVYGASTREIAEATAMKSAPDLVVVDASHPEAVTWVAAVRARLPTVKVIVLAVRERDEEFLAWVRIGISGYLGPDTSAHDLISTLRRAGAGEVVCPPRLTALLMDRFANRSNDHATRAGIYALTSREQQIVALLADGLSSKLIARRLCLALATVKSHIHNILDKWDVRSRGEAAAYYRQKVRGEGEPNAGRVVELQMSQVRHIENATLQNGTLRVRAEIVAAVQPRCLPQ